MCRPPSFDIRLLSFPFPGFLSYKPTPCRSFGNADLILYVSLLIIFSHSLSVTVRSSRRVHPENPITLSFFILTKPDLTLLSSTTLHQSETYTKLYLGCLNDYRTNTPHSFFSRPTEVPKSDSFISYLNGIWLYSVHYPPHLDLRSGSYSGNEWRKLIFRFCLWTVNRDIWLKLFSFILITNTMQSETPNSNTATVSYDTWTSDSSRHYGTFSGLSTLNLVFFH